MDENYLDSLLNEITLDEEIDDKIEDELDEEIVSDSDNNRSDDSIDRHVEEDSRQAVEIKDTVIAREQFDELDELDTFADIDMEGLDFDDIDFDDIDVTNINLSTKQDNISDLEDFEDVNIDSFFDEEETINQDKSYEEEFIEDREEYEDSDKVEIDSNEEREDSQSNYSNEETAFESEDDSFFNNDSEEDDSFFSEDSPSVETVKDVTSNNVEEDDSFFSNEEESSSSSSSNDDFTEDDFFEDFQMDMNTSKASEDNEDSELNKTNRELDDLFSMLGIDNEEKTKEEVVSFNKEEEPLFEDSVNVVSDMPIKSKKTISQIIFGDPDEEEDEGASLAELEAKKAAKAAKKAEKEAANAEKQQASQAAKASKAAERKVKEVENNQKKLAKKKANEQAMLEAVPDKKISKVTIAFLFTLAVVIIGGTFLGTQTFSYSLVIKKATDYFDRDKYRMAYNEVAGVEVKDKDKELKDRIYTVMYVERLYETYNNNLNKMGRPDKALDSLLRGLEKYDEHYQEAVDLGIVEDIDKSREKIIKALQDTYGISLEEASRINSLSSYEYVDVINQYAAPLMSTQENEEGSTASEEGSTASEEGSRIQEDAILPEQQTSEAQTEAN